MNIQFKYHVIKKSRLYEGRGYCGASSRNIPMEFIELFMAEMAVEKLTERNPVGWDIYNANTGKLIK